MKNKLMKMQFLLLLTTVVVVQSFAQSNSIKINKEHPRLILSNADIDLMRGNALSGIVPKEKLEALQQEYPRIPYYELADGRVKIPAGWMIDQCGWKGKALGPAAVHDKQALVLVNRGGAKGSDIIALSDAVRASVREKFGIDIHPEVNFIN